MSGKEGDVAKLGRRDRLIKEEIHDPYMAQSKPVEPTQCLECGVVFSGGRWQWQSDVAQDAHRELCPACRRIQDKVPAGILTLSGEFFKQHRDEIMRILHNKEQEQKAQRPMKRLMDIEDRGDGSTVATFTDVHLPQGVGKAIERAYKGELDIQFTEEAGIVRVFWQR
jgi:hypothetical protein